MASAVSAAGAQEAAARPSPRPDRPSFTPPEPGPAPACRSSNTPCTSATSRSPPAGLSAGTARRSTSRLSWPAGSWELRSSTVAFGASASCPTIWDASIRSREPWRPSTIRSARGCHLCLRYVPQPMSPGRTTRRLAVLAVMSAVVSAGARSMSLSTRGQTGNFPNFSEASGVVRCQHADITALFLKIPCFAEQGILFA